MVREPKVYFHYDVTIEPSTDESTVFDCQPVDFKFECQVLPGGGGTKGIDNFRREEHTLCIINPCAYKDEGKIIQAIRAEGFTILKRKTLLLFPEQAVAIHRHHYGRTWYPRAILSLGNDPIIVMVLAKQNAVEDLKTLCGPVNVSAARKYRPFSLRAQFGLKGDLTQNAVHASNSIEDAKREILYFFKHANPAPLIPVKEKFDAFMGTRYTLLLQGLTELCKQKPINPSLKFYNYLVANKKSDTPILTMPE